MADEKTRELDGIPQSLALGDLIQNTLPDIKSKEIINKAQHTPSTGLMANSNLLGIDGSETTNNMLVNALDNSSNPNKFISFALDGLSACSLEDTRDNTLALTRSSAPINIPNSTLNSSLSDFNSGGFAVNIPNSSLTYSPTNHSSLFGVSDAFTYSSSNTNKLSNSLTATTQNDNNIFFPSSRIISPGFADGLSMSPSVRITELNSIRDDNSSSVNSLFDNSLAAPKNAFSLQSLQNQSNSDMSRLNSELMSKNTQLVKLKWEKEEAYRKLSVSERQREKALSDAQEWKGLYELAQTQLNLSTELRSLSIQKLKQLQSKLRTDLEDVEKVLYLENAKKCMKCEENNRTVTLEPCNHLILCDNCACSVTECPYCQVLVETTHT